MGMPRKPKYLGLRPTRWEEDGQTEHCITVVTKSLGTTQHGLTLTIPEARRLASEIQATLDEFYPISSTTESDNK